MTKPLVETAALLLQRVPVGEADAICGFFTERAGALSAIARGARRANGKRFAGLEPLHRLHIVVAIAPGRELGTLKEATIEAARIGLQSSLAAMESAGRALRWVRRAAPSRTAEPALWQTIETLLDRLDGLQQGRAAEAEGLLAAAGLRLLAAAGWGLDLERCVRCGTACPERASVRVDVEAGGVVCRRCGAPLAAIALTAEQRRAMLAALAGDDQPLLRHAVAAIRLVERALAVHGIDG